MGIMTLGIRTPSMRLSRFVIITASRCWKLDPSRLALPTRVIRDIMSAVSLSAGALFLKDVLLAIVDIKDAGIGNAFTTCRKRRPMDMVLEEIASSASKISAVGILLRSVLNLFISRLDRKLNTSRISRPVAEPLSA